MNIVKKIALGLIVAAYATAPVQASVKNAALSGTAGFVVGGAAGVIGGGTLVGVAAAVITGTIVIPALMLNEYKKIMSEAKANNVVLSKKEAFKQTRTNLFGTKEATKKTLTKASIITAIATGAGIVGGGCMSGTFNGLFIGGMSGIAGAMIHATKKAEKTPTN